MSADDIGTVNKKPEPAFDHRIAVPFLEGEFERPHVIRARAQFLFLDIVARVTPAPLYSLRDDVLPRFQSALEVETTLGARDDEFRKLTIHAVVDVIYIRKLRLTALPRQVQLAKKKHPLVYAAGEELIGWSERCNLTGRASGPEETFGEDSRAQYDNWPVVIALDTLFFWLFDPLGPMWLRRKPPAWCPPLYRLTAELKTHAPENEVLPPIRLRASHLDLPSGVKCEIDMPGWYISLESDSVFRTRMRQGFERWLEDYAQLRVQSARAAGLVRVPEKRKLIQQFTWLAKYQVGGMSRGRLASEYHRKLSAIEEGLDAAFKLVGLEKRPPARGGTKGSKRKKA